MKYLLLSFLLIQGISAAAGTIAGPSNNGSAHHGKTHAPVATILYVKSDAVGTGNGDSWTNAYTKLQDALTNAGPGVTQIWVAKGTYYPDEGGGYTDNDRGSSFRMRINLAIYGGFAGTETLLSQRNWKINKTVLSGDIDQNDGPAFANNSGNSYHVILGGGDNTAVLDGLWVTGGNANGQLPTNPDPNDLLPTSDYVPGEGGGMFTYTSSPTVVNCSFFGNWGSAGGAIANVAGAPLITNSSFSGNMADNSGGALYFNAAEPTVTNCSFSGNVANSRGGGMYVNAVPGYASLQLINCSFSGNTGGALFADNTPLPITNCIFWGNSSEISSYILNNEPTVTYSIVKGGYSGAGNLNVDPLFADAASGNLHLKSGSPAINSGNDAANSQPTDLDGNARKNGIIDMGAYEFSAACPSGNILYVNAAASGNNDGTSWSNAYTKLQDALANTCAGVTQIWVAEGTYYPDEGGGKTDNDMQAAFSMKNNMVIYGGFAGAETTLSQRNWKTNKTILSGDIDQNDGSGFTNHDNNAAHVIYNNGLNNTAIIDGFVIASGNGDNAQGTNPVGGGMYNVNSPVMINNCTISGNSAIDGGGIFNANSSISMSDCALLGNSGGGSGGAMYNGQSSGPALVSCEFFGNSGNQGGAIFNSDGGGVYLVNCTVSGNTASDGGGLYNLDGGSATVINSIFWGNSSEIFFIPGFFGGSPVAMSYSIVKGGFAGTGNLDVDPLFVNQANGDLHLTACSPAIDAGDDASNDRATDLDSNPRMIDAKAGGAKIDMGAFEYQGTLPSATLTGSKTVCLNSSTTTVTFTGSGGTPGYVFTVTLGGQGFTLSTRPGSSADVAIPTDVATQYTFDLLSVYDNNTSSCPQLINGQTATVIVNPLPTATIAGSTIVCKGDAQPNITFSGSGGASPYTFKYTLFDGTNTTTNTVVGDPGLVPAITTAPGTYTYTLISVQSAGTTACSQDISGQAATVTVNPFPDATIITAASVTAASSGNIASVPDAGSGASYSWTINNGTIAAGLGTASITYKAGNSGSVTLSVSVKSGSGCGPVPGSVIVPTTALPCPNPAISVAPFVCSGTTGNKASVANAGTGAKYVWTIINGTITGGSGTSQISFTAGINKYADYGSDDFVKISVKVTNASGLCTEPSGTYKVFISPIPSATIVTSTTVCSKSGNNCASIPFAGLGARYSWTITNGTITSGTGTRSITYTAGTSGSIILAVIVTNYNGCSSSSGNKSITIAALPVANITSTSSVCGGSGGNTASVTTGPNGTKYCWNISNGCINSGSSASTISYTAGSSGSVTLSVTVTNSSGCKTYSGNKVVTISSTPNATITAPSVACASSTGNSASVPSAGSGASYQWTVSGGTITSGSGTNSVKFTAGSSGYVTLSITIANSNGCKKSSSKKITIAANVIPTFTQIGPLCKGSKAPLLPTKSTNGIPGSWSPSSISTGSSVTTTYTFTPAAGQCASTTKMQIKVQSCGGGTVTKSVATEEVINEKMDARLLQNPTHSEFTLIIKGIRNQSSEINIYDMLGRKMDHLRANDGESLRFGNRYINGIYLVEVIQGTERKFLMAVKQ